MSRNRKSRKAHKKRLQRRPQIQKLDDRQLFAADTPFDGSALLYQIHGHGSEQGQLSTIDVSTGDFNSVGDNAGYKINATGYRTSDDFIYGIKRQDDSLVRLDANGSVTNLGQVEGLPDLGYYSGDIGPDGLLYLWSKDRLFGVNVDTQNVDRVVELSRSMKPTHDLAYNPVTELLYGVEKASNRTRSFVSIDLDTGQVTTINDRFEPSTGIYGAVFSDATGRVFAANNNGGLYEVDPATGESTYAGYSPRASTNDGSSPSSATINLPPVVLNQVVATTVEAENVQVNIDTPVDMEGDTLTISIDELPSDGIVKYADGEVVEVGDSLTIEQLTSLLYDAPSIANQSPQNLRYSVSDSEHTTPATVEFLVDGLSSLEGRVIVEHDNDDDAYEGYAFNNEIRLTGTTATGDSVSLVTASDINGDYSFADLEPGTYTISQVQPDVVKDSYSLGGELDGNSDGNVIADLVIPSGPGRAFSGFDFVEMAPSSVSGFVHIDEDSDGLLDGAEAGIANVSMVLSGLNDIGQRVEASTTTDINGFYEFSGLRPGDYSVTQIQPSEFIDSAVNAGSVGGFEITNAVKEIELNAGTVATHYDFGELTPTSISGNVYLDNDWDKLLDRGDSPIAGNAVQLTGVDQDGNAVSLTTMTNEDGEYRFDNLIPGTYSVQQLDQPVGLEDGRDNLGNFLGESGSISRNGSVGNDVFTGIEIQQGETAVGYNFGETLVYQLVSEYDNALNIYGTDADDSFEFIAGTSSHQIIHNGETIHELDASIRHNVQFFGLGGSNSIEITGTEDVETARLRPFSADYHTRTFRVRSAQTAENYVYNGGGYDRLYVYDSEGNDQLRGTETYVRMTGEGFTNVGYGFHRTYSYSTNGGDDRAVLTDSKKDDTFRASATNARMFGRTYYNNVRSFERVYAKAVHGGEDRAILWDSEADGDVFHSTPDYARLFNNNEGYYNFATGFDDVLAYANQGGDYDRAYFKDTEGDDILVSTQTETGLATESYTHTVRDFERMQAFSTQGHDRAYLYDSKLDDKFRALPEYATLYNSEYYLKVNDYAQVDAFSSGGGNDRAYFYDSAGDDTLVAMENEVRLFGDGFDNTSHGFQRAYAFSQDGGTDQAILYDGDLADSLKVSSGMTRMYSPTYYTRADGFDAFDVVFSDLSNQDRALIFGGMSQDTLAQAGSLAKHMSENSSSYIHDADAVASMEGSDDVTGDVYAAPGEDGDVWDIALKDF